jgi:hypothetical protein
MIARWSFSAGGKNEKLELSLCSLCIPLCLCVKALVFKKIK